MDVPFGVATTSWETILLPSILRWVPTSLSAVRVCISTWAIAAIDAKASPRKPLVSKLNKSCADDILEVAWRSKDKRASVSLIPTPLSTTWISVFPPSFIINLMEVEPASMAFSMSSFTTEAGRWTTSPAAIWLATWSGKSLMMSAIMDLRILINQNR